MSASTIAARIKLARKMAGLATQAQLLQEIEGWKPSRLGNYEAGVSTPNADDVKRIAAAAGVSPCWLMFGDGPIRPDARDTQAIRHQNLSHVVQQLESKRGALARFAKLCGSTKAQLMGYLENPFEPISEKLCGRIENALGHEHGWMDEQHVEDDPVCQSFPDDIRELITLYSGLSSAHRNTAMVTLRALVAALNASGTGTPTR